MAQPVVSKLLHVIDFKKWFPVGILRYRIYYGKIYIWQHSVYYSVPLHCSWTRWKIFPVVSNTLFREEATQGDFLQEALEAGCGAITGLTGKRFTSPSRPSKTRGCFRTTSPPRLSKNISSIKSSVLPQWIICYISEHFKEYIPGSIVPPTQPLSIAIWRWGRKDIFVILSHIYFFILVVPELVQLFSQLWKGTSSKRSHEKHWVG